MPVIPMYQQRTEAGGAFDVRAPAEAFGGGFAQAGQRIAAGLEDIGQAKGLEQRYADHLLKQQEERDGKAWAGETVAKAHLEWATTLAERRESAKPGAPNFTPSLVTDFDKYSADVVGNAPTPLAKQFAQAHMLSLRDTLINQSLSFEAQARIQNRSDQAQNSIDASAKVVQQNPAQYAAMFSLLKETMPYGGIHDERFQDAARKALTNAAGSQVLDADPYKMQEYTSKALGDKGFSGKVGVPWIDDATPEQIKQWNNAATVKIHMLESEQARNAEAGNKVAEKMFGDATDLVFKGQYMSEPYKAQLRAAVKGRPWEQATEELIRSQSVTAGFASAPAGDRNAVLNQMRNRGADPAQGTNPESAKQLAKIEAIDGEIGKAVRENPWVAAQQYGVTKDASLGNIATPADALRLIQQRSLTQTQVEGWAGSKTYPGGGLSPLQPQEAVQLGNVLAAMPIPARTAAIAEIGDMLPLGRRLALADQLNPKDDALALSLQVTDKTNAGRQVSELIQRGAQALKDKTIKEDGAALSGWRAEIAKLVRDAGLSPRAEENAINAAYYVRAAMDESGKEPEGFKLGVSEKKAVSLVLGVPLERNGVKSFLPRGIESEGDFDRALATYTPDVVKGIAPGGLFVRGRPISAERFSEAITRYGMRADGNGNYLPSSGGALVTTDPEGTKPLRLPVSPAVNYVDPSPDNAETSRLLRQQRTPLAPDVGDPTVHGVRQ